MVSLTALTIAAEGGKADIAKPLQGIGSGILEIALPFKGDAFRVVYALQLGPDIWVIHAFQKKSTTGMKTPKREIDLVKDRLKRLQETNGQALNVRLLFTSHHDVIAFEAVKSPLEHVFALWLDDPNVQARHC